MKNAHNKGQQAECMERSGDHVLLHDMNNAGTSCLISSAHAISGNVQRSTRIGVRRIGGSNGVSSLANLSKVSAVNSSVLVATWPNRAPAFKDSMLSFDGKSVFSVKASYIRPINNDGGEGVSNSQSTIGEKNRRAIQETINQGGDKNDKSYRSTLTKVERIAFNQDGRNHSGTKYVASSTIKVSSTGAKELRITTGFSQVFEGGSRHE
jgi:hypothetical protein